MNKFNNGKLKSILTEDVNSFEVELQEIISNSKFLVIGGAGSIGQAVTKEIFKRNPVKLHVIDISENNLVELVRDIRSDIGYIKGDFQTFAIDAGSDIYNSFIKNDGKYDYILNLSALKHVRSEKDPFTLMRMIEVNILNTIKTIQLANENNSSKYFCVSTDKAANPVNMMGASKRIMEMYLLKYSTEIDISTARFANVAFSDGSLLDGFKYRLEKQQPIVAPNDIRRYFINKEDSGLLCLFSCLFGENRDIYFPKINQEKNLFSFSEIAITFLQDKGLEPYLCESEEEARTIAKELPKGNLWPCYFTESNTTGEKYVEEFFTEYETLDLVKYKSIGIIKNEPIYNEDELNRFLDRISSLRSNGWNKKDIVELFLEIIPNFDYEDKGIFLDSKM
jgi:nucleoside-diphosphate-sugar epimerase